MFSNDLIKLSVFAGNISVTEPFGTIDATSFTNATSSAENSAGFVDPSNYVILITIPPDAKNDFAYQ